MLGTVSAVPAAVTDQELLEQGALLGDEVRKWWSQQRQQQHYPHEGEQQQQQQQQQYPRQQLQQTDGASLPGEGDGLRSALGGQPTWWHSLSPRTSSSDQSPRDLEGLPVVALLGQLLARGQSWETISRYATFALFLSNMPGPSDRFRRASCITC
jgi:hypothetical protein